MREILEIIQCRVYNLHVISLHDIIRIVHNEQSEYDCNLYVVPLEVTLKMRNMKSAISDKNSIIPIGLKSKLAVLIQLQ